MGSILRYGVLLLLTTVPVSMCIMFKLYPNSQRCLREEVDKNELVLGDFEISEAPDQRIDYIVTDTKGHVLSQNSGVNKSKFTFTTDRREMYEICFRCLVPPNQKGIVQNVRLNTKKGVEVIVPYALKGEVSKLKPIEMELRHQEILASSIIDDFIKMKRRELSMRNTNESTNARVLYWGLFTLFTFFMSASWQILYLRKFFKSKKLIE